ncbi:MAG: hypothetical protein H6Q31_1376 [Bacteroidetes bacterium]|nr:hypothetical protein [Bacteroidota bacterium]
MKCIVAVWMLFWAWSGIQAQPVVTPLSSGGTYDASILSPGALLGFVPGDRPARYTQVMDYCRYLASKSNRVRCSLSSFPIRHMCRNSIRYAASMLDWLIRVR